MIKIKKEIKDIKFLDKNIRFGERTYIMGILNVTPDSFSDGGDFIDIHNAVNHAKDMIQFGVDIIDVGGESSRPGHKNITEEEELKRVIPVIKSLSAKTDAIISLDTIRSKVAEEAIKQGAHIINDIWGLQKDPNMAKVVAKYKVPVIIMHNQNGTDYNNIIEDIKGFFKQSIAIAKDAGISEDMIILDPGIGFGKTPQQNIMVMSKLDEIKSLGYPLLLGTSRKSMLGKILDLPPKERVEGTLATTILGIVQGVDIVRVHDVKENLRAAKVADAIIRGE
ncbi:dihydropteroate synthase FolP [Clostridium putrefaciens]|uniref:Dihydropteroate synthase n=1 Tax=Clostridium putrefaciens TaxID=99675 RepID=A0A381J4M7_9CLOT|nr:dihydropteroate synthase [Clostridium putrefaciens]SUY46029.1 dihydropteroate synthase FolP [Clostridium putrefaciens]